MKELSLFAEQIAQEDAAAAAAAAVGEESRRDRIGERLIDLGYVANDFQLDLNSHLGVWPALKDVTLPHPFSLPSRLMRWPVEHCRYDRDSKDCWSGEETQTRLGLSHPLLAEHPLVLKLKADGFEVRDEGVLFETANYSSWHHAVDLCTDAHWEALVETKNFTEDEAIYSAVAFKVGYRSENKADLSLKSARDVMDAMRSPEPLKREAWRKFREPSVISEAKNADRWPINANLNSKEEEAWAMIHAIEDGAIAFHGNFLGWTPKGRSTFGCAAVLA